jgi:hypothetical protein
MANLAEKKTGAISKTGHGGPRPNSGGLRPGSGRKPGVPNKVTRELKDLARQYTDVAIMELARLATEAESEAARVAAIKELFDRGYGKATQTIAGDPDNPLQTHQVIEQVIIESPKGRGS